MDLPVYCLMNPNMLCQIAVLSKASVANSTNVRFEACVDSHMIEQIPDFLERFIAVSNFTD